MIGYRGGAASPVSEALEKQAETLRNVVREAVRTSPDSFFKTLSDVEAKETDYWIDEIQRSTWVVAERDGEVVGVAAAKFPEQGKDKESPRNSRYIESVWIDPNLRRRHLAERLIKYLMAVEFQKNPDINRFLLWVFETNLPAIKLYKYMKFAKTRQKHNGIKTEIKYRLYVSPRTRAAICQTVSRALVEDKEKLRVTYRVLG
jgi:ribosomal protein S18 acetylase RimI-like enzyme